MHVSATPVIDRLIADLHKDRPWVIETQTFAEALADARRNA